MAGDQPGVVIALCIKLPQVTTPPASLLVLQGHISLFRAEPTQYSLGQQQACSATTVMIVTYFNPASR